MVLGGEEGVMSEISAGVRSLERGSEFKYFRQIACDSLGLMT